jgi:hypothetical protein
MGRRASELASISIITKRFAFDWNCKRNIRYLPCRKELLLQIYVWPNNRQANITTRDMNDTLNKLHRQWCNIWCNGDQWWEIHVSKLSPLSAIKKALGGKRKEKIEKFLASMLIDCLYYDSGEL